MSRKVKGTNETPTKPSFESVRWVNRNLTEEEKSHHDQQKVKPEQLLKDLTGLALGGYNIAIKWDAYSSCFQVTLIPYNPACPNHGYGLSARSGDPYRAISLLLYKHFAVLSEDWVSHYTAPKNSFEG